MNVTVVDSSDSVAKCCEGSLNGKVLLFDGFSAHLPPPDVLEDCKKFSKFDTAKNKQAVVQSFWQKICTDKCVCFSQALKSKNWTGPAERVLRMTFWGSNQYRVGAHDYLKNKPSNMQAILAKLFRLRYQSVKAEFQFVGGPMASQ